ncbi:hypothetical protein [Massilia sp. PWRC2]|uniref:hypothetical protein n=1 Tax=Massilia sp. PWRC2 TaxID=2804626 RepID=UPI003CF87A57
MSAFYVVSVKHTQREQPYITFWRPDNKGYAWPLSWAGQYSEAEVAADLEYYHNGYDSFAIPCALMDSLAVPPALGTIDNNAGPVVMNTKLNWKFLIEFAKPGVLAKPNPQYKGARRHKEST